MIRIFFENLLLFLLPSFIYIAWVIFVHLRKADGDENAGKGLRFAALLDDAPLLWLFASGALLVIVTLAIFGTSSGGQPGQHYQPSIFKDGKIQPGHIE